MSPSFGSHDHPKDSSDTRAVDAALSEEFLGGTAGCSSPSPKGAADTAANLHPSGDVSLFLNNGASNERLAYTVRKVHHPRFRIDWIDVRDGAYSRPEGIRLTLVYEPDPKILRVINLSEVLEGAENRTRIENSIVGIVNTPPQEGQNIQYEIDFVLREIVPSLLQQKENFIPAFQNRASKHREPLSLTQRFAPDVSEFLRGINRTAFLLMRGDELLAEFVLVDDGRSQISAYVTLAGANQPLPFFNVEGKITSLETFPIEVFDTVYPLLRAKFAPLGQVLTFLTEELNARRCSTLLTGNTKETQKDKVPAILTSSSDWMRVSQSNQESLRFGDSSVRTQPRMVVPSLPIDQHYTFSAHRSLPTALGGEVQLFPLAGESQTLVRFVATSSRKPAVFLEATIPATVEQIAQRVSRFTKFENKRLVSEGIARLIHDKSSQHIRLFGSVLGDSYSLKARELLSHINQSVADAHQLHFGFISDVLPSLAREPADAAVEVLSGNIPFGAIVDDRAPGQYSVCQYLVDSEGRGSVTFYSRLGAALSFATFDVPGQPDALKDSLANLYRAFIEEPQALTTILPSCPGLGLEYCSEEPLADLDTKIHLEELAEEWWQNVPTFGYGSDELFPVLTRSQVMWSSYTTVHVRIPLPRCSPFLDFKCTVTSEGIESVDVKERHSSHYQEPAVLTIRPREGAQITAERILSAVTAVSTKGLLQTKAYRECERVFPKEQFYFERTEPPIREVPKSDGILSGTLYTMKEWLFWLRCRLPW